MTEKAPRPAPQIFSDEPSPRSFETPHGHVSLVVDQGIGRPDQADRAAVVSLPVEQKFGLMIIDGYQADGATAAQLLAEEEAGAIASGRTFADVHRRGHEAMRALDLRSGACYVAIRHLHGARWELGQAGDPRAVAFDSSGQKLFSTRDEHVPGKPHVVTNSVNGRRLTRPTLTFWELSPAVHSILLGSDGLWGNLTIKKVGQILRRYPDPQEAIAVLKETALEKMKTGHGRPDNLSAILFQPRLDQRQ